MPCWRDRHRAQAGATLVEVLVSLVILGFALVLIVGTFSTGLLDAALTKRNTAAEAVVQYELDSVLAKSFSASAPAYSDCFATENTTAPTPASGFQGSCPGAFTLRADVSWVSGPSGVQMWSVSVTSLSNGAQIGSPTSEYKANR